jgi:hypothetical protein
MARVRVPNNVRDAIIAMQWTARLLTGSLGVAERAVNNFPTATSPAVLAGASD